MKIGIYNKEIFIEKENNWGVLRLVDVDTLDSLHTADGLIEFGWGDIWKESVHNDWTILGLYEWLEGLINEEDDGDERFVGKDASYLDELTDEERKIADQYIYDTYGIEVGTWECGGFYPPDGEFEIILRDE